MVWASSGGILAVRLGAGVRARPAVIIVASAAAAATVGIGVAVHAGDGGLHPLCLDAADSVESTLQRHVAWGQQLTVVNKWQAAIPCFVGFQGRSVM